MTVTPFLGDGTPAAREAAERRAADAVETMASLREEPLSWVV